MPESGATAIADLDQPPAIHAPFDLAELDVPQTGGSLEIPRFVPATRRCDAGNGAEIVVCAPDPDRFSIEVPNPKNFVVPDKDAPMELRLGDNVVLAGDTEEVVIGGVKSARVMVRIKLGL